jgi:hypothetical protein
MIVIVLVMASHVVKTDCFPLDSVFARGDSTISIQWKPTVKNTRLDWYLKCCPTVPALNHCDFIAGVTYRSEAYSYSNEDSYHVFCDRLAKGFLAGSQECHYTSCGNPDTVATGTDCTGFLCYVWNEPRENTTEIISNPKFIHIARDSLKPGDAFVKTATTQSSKHHAVLIVEVLTRTNWLIWESTGTPVNGCRQRFINPSDSIWDGFAGIRNPAILSSNIRSRPEAPRLASNDFLRSPILSACDIRGRKIGAESVVSLLSASRGRKSPGVYIMWNKNQDGTVSVFRIPLIQ